MVLPEEIMADGDYRDIVDDITTECGKYGVLVGVTVPRPPAPGSGRVFLQYTDTSGAYGALSALAGRLFSTRTIVAKYYDEGAFRAGMYTMP